MAAEHPPTRRLAGAYGRGTVVYERGRLWIENQDPATRTGATIGWVRRYQAADGQLYAVLLGAYLLLTLLPALLVEASYLYDDPNALSNRVIHRLDLTGSAASLFRTVMVGSGNHKLGAVAIALIDLFFFGLGFGRVLQLVYARSWRIDVRKSVVADQERYLFVLLVLLGFCLGFVLQTRALRGQPSWIGWTLDLAWLVALGLFFVWAPRLLLHNRVARRDVVPGAAFAVAGFVVLRLVSYVLLKHWLVWYSNTYGALGIVMAIVFWLIAVATVLVLAAALSPALAHRRDLLAARTHAHVA
jgi:uncharacterized BrkB/YihY/UPF0761 family membrane protein